MEEEMVLVLEEEEGTTTTTTPAWSRTVTPGPGCRTTPMLPPLAPGQLVQDEHVFNPYLTKVF